MYSLSVRLVALRNLNRGHDMETGAETPRCHDVNDRVLARMMRQRPG
jgi:hypothetical protein